jgi:hypothetical protein
VTPNQNSTTFSLRNQTAFDAIPFRHASWCRYRTREYWKCALSFGEPRGTAPATSGNKEGTNEPSQVHFARRRSPRENKEKKGTANYWNQREGLFTYIRSNGRRGAAWYAPGLRLAFLSKCSFFPFRFVLKTFYGCTCILCSPNSFIHHPYDRTDAENSFCDPCMQPRRASPCRRARSSSMSLAITLSQRISNLTFVHLSKSTFDPLALYISAPEQFRGNLFDPRTWSFSTRDASPRRAFRCRKLVQMCIISVQRPTFICLKFPDSLPSEIGFAFRFSFVSVAFTASPVTPLPLRFHRPISHHVWKLYAYVFISQGTDCWMARGRAIVENVSLGQPSRPCAQGKEDIPHRKEKAGPLAEKESRRIETRLGGESLRAPTAIAPQEGASGV